MPLVPLDELAVELSDGSEVVTTTCAPADRPLTIWVRLSPFSPTTTRVGTDLPLRSSLTVLTEPLPVTALEGSVTPDA